MGKPTKSIAGDLNPAAPPQDTRAAIYSVLGSTALRQALVYVAAVVATGALVMWLLYGYTSQILSRQLLDTMTVEADGIAELAAVGGTGAAVAAISLRARRANGRIYLLEDGSAKKLAGNLDGWPAELPRVQPGGTFHYRLGDNGTGVAVRGANRLAAGVASTLPEGMRLLVGRDLAAQRALAERAKWLFLTGFGALALAGLAAGLVASRLALRRISDMTRTTDAVMAGDFSGRVRLAGSGDELDQLARNLNAMLDRIGELMAGLREVSDNIAHDLKTPLSRLRSRAEAALREAGEASSEREALGHVIEDADELIKTFNALLLIARLEAGAIEGTAEAFDLSALADDVAELYEPVAEEVGLQLRASITSGVGIVANRQLVGQALANMIDNAIKYGKPPLDASTGHAAGPLEVAAVQRIDVGVRRTEGWAMLEVADHGPGIPAADRERVLKRFVRLEASRTRPGTGLGLSLVAAVARLHGGQVLLEDNAPGLRIVLMLPLAKLS